MYKCEDVSPTETSRTQKGTYYDSTQKEWAPVPHTYNPSYSGGRIQEDHGLKPSQANSS
jgi:hypothetical protein